MFDFDELPDDLGGPNVVERLPTLRAHDLLPEQEPKEVEELWDVPCSTDGGNEKDQPCLSVRVARLNYLPGRAPLCVLVVPGTPAESTGGARATDRLYTDFVQMCWNIGLPTVRFDYRGFGLGVGGMLGGDLAITPLDTQVVLKRVLAEHGERAVVLAHSGGNGRFLQAMADIPSEKIAAYININWGIHPLGYGLVDDNFTLAKGEALHEYDVQRLLDFLGRFDGPTLCICGKQDRLTRPEYYENIANSEVIARRTTRIELAVVPGGHAFEGQEEEVSKVAKRFLSALTPA